MNKEELIKKIVKFQDKLRIIDENNYQWSSISEEESVISDINNYIDDDFNGWYIKDFILYIKYLKELTKIKYNSIYATKKDNDLYEIKIDNYGYYNLFINNKKVKKYKTADNLTNYARYTYNIILMI